jgi:hypothetical protein
MMAYIFQAALLCEDCGDKVCAELTAAGKAPKNPDDEYSYDSDDFPKGPYPEAGGEADVPHHCDKCGEFLENPLTSEGVEYVKEACLAALEHTPSGTDSVALDVWAKFYEISLEPDDEGEECAECGKCIPEVEGGSLENKHHDPSCSLYDADKK